jgi:glycosyltransferase involved in cell wall biosynthesis
VIYVGSLIPRKSVETLLRAIRQLRDRQHEITCAIVGDGPQASVLRRLVKEWGLVNVVFAGHQPPTLVSSWIAAAHVLVLPSRSEGRGLVLAEALALGIPVVASDIPGVDELAVEGVTGLRFPVDDAPGLADCLGRLRADPALRARLGRGGIALVESEGLSLAASAQRHAALYAGVTSARATMGRAAVSPVHRSISGPGS